MTNEAIIDKTYTDDYCGMERLPILGPVDSDTEILKAYFGANPSKPNFGQILTVIQHENRFFLLNYNVWHKGQKLSDANKLTNIQELCVQTPYCELDSNTQAVRAVTNVLKTYSIKHKLYDQLRRKIKHGDNICLFLVTELNTGDRTSKVISTATTFEAAWSNMHDEFVARIQKLTGIDKDQLPSKEQGDWSQMIGMRWFYIVSCMAGIVDVENNTTTHLAISEYELDKNLLIQQAD